MFRFTLHESVHASRHPAKAQGPDFSASWDMHVGIVTLLLYSDAETAGICIHVFTLFSWFISALNEGSQGWVGRLKCIIMCNQLWRSFVYFHRQTAAMYYSHVAHSVIIKSYTTQNKKCCRPRAAHLQTWWAATPPPLCSSALRSSSVERNEKDLFIRKSQTGTRRFEMQIARK